MQTSIPYIYEFQGSSNFNLIETEDGDIIIEVHRSSEGVFEDEYFDVEVFIARPSQDDGQDPTRCLIGLVIHEACTKLHISEELAMRDMVKQYLKTKQ